MERHIKPSTRAQGIFLKTRDYPFLFYYLAC